MPKSQKFGFRHFDTTRLSRQSFPLRRYQPAEPKEPRERPPSVKRMVGARIFSHPDNSPVRTPGGRGGLNPRGYIPSYKTLRKQPFESDPEFDYMLVFEADADVVAYFMQPHRLEMYVVGRDDPLVYFPHVRLEDASGKVKIHEIKVTEDAARGDPDYALKLQLAEEVYAEQGWDFEVLTEEGLRDDLYRLANARKIAGDSDTVLGTADVLRLRSHMDGCNGVSTYHDVARALAPDGTEPEFVGRAKLHALIVQRRIRMDLRMRLLPAAPVWLVADNGGEVAR